MTTVPAAAAAAHSHQIKHDDGSTSQWLVLVNSMTNTTQHGRGCLTTTI
jgi:hypothetical protein